MSDDIDRDRAERERRPRDPATGQPRPALAQPGYYPGQSALRQQAFWDATTRATVLERVEKVPELRFFTPSEAKLYGDLFDRLLPQTDRDTGHRIPILPRVDARLWEGKGSGYRFEDMLADPDAYRAGAAALDEAAREGGAAGFVSLSLSAQEELLLTLQAGRPPPGAPDTWKQLSPSRFFLLLLGDALDAYYAHPWAWDEIGYGGPAYPRGYFRLEHGLPEPWEVAERRYRWEAPKPSRSDHLENGDRATGNQSAPGQGGSH